MKGGNPTPELDWKVVVLSLRQKGGFGRANASGGGDPCGREGFLSDFSTRGVGSSS